MAASVMRRVISWLHRRPERRYARQQALNGMPCNDGEAPGHVIAERPSSGHGVTNIERY